MEKLEVSLLNQRLIKLNDIEKQLNRIADALEEENNLSKEIIGSNKINRLLEVVLLAMSRMANNNEVVKNE